MPLQFLSQDRFEINDHYPPMRWNRIRLIDVSHIKNPLSKGAVFDLLFSFVVFSLAKFAEFLKDGYFIKPIFSFWMPEAFQFFRFFPKP